MEFVVLQLVEDNKPTRRIVKGVRYVTVPVTLLVPGVLRGSKGPLLYRPTDVKKTARLWDQIPIVKDHPMKSGEYVSVNELGTLKNVLLGFISRPYFDSALRATAWFDESATQRVFPNLLKRIWAGEPVEVSTGLFTENRPKAGEFKGHDYEYIATNHQPDHLAVLTKDAGACSVQDGCGLNVNKKASKMKPKTKFVMTANCLGDLSFQAFTSKLKRAFKKRHLAANARINEIFDNFIVFTSGGRTFREAFSIKDGAVVLSGKAVEVRSHVTNALAVNAAAEEDMDEEYDEEYSEDLEDNEELEDDEILEDNEEDDDMDDMGVNEDDEEEEVVLEENEEDEEDELDALEESEDEDEEPVTMGCDTKGSKKKKPTGNSRRTHMARSARESRWLAKAPPAIRRLVSNALSDQEKKRKRLISRIVANTNNRFTRAYLSKRSVEELRGLAALAANSIDDDFDDSFYGVAPANNFLDASADEDILPPHAEMSTAK